MSARVFRRRDGAVLAGAEACSPNSASLMPNRWFRLDFVRKITIFVVVMLAGGHWHKRPLLRLELRAIPLHGAGTQEWLRSGELRTWEAQDYQRGCTNARGLSRVALSFLV